MEPCLFRHGKPRRGRGLTLVRPRASMEPCLFRHGKTTLELETPFFSKASMEPCLFRHGKSIIRFIADLPRHRFNGAMSFQTW